MEREGGGGELWYPPHQEIAKYKTRHCLSTRGIISVDRRRRTQLANSFGRKTRSLSHDVILRGNRAPGTGERKQSWEQGRGWGRE